MNRFLQALVAILVASAGLGATPAGVLAVDGDGYSLEVPGSIPHHQFLGVADRTVSGVVGVAPGDTIAATVLTPSNVPSVVTLTVGSVRTDRPPVATAEPVEGVVSFATTDLAPGPYRLGIVDATGTERAAVLVVLAAVQFDHSAPSGGAIGESLPVQVTALGGLTGPDRGVETSSVSVVLTPVGASPTASTSLAVAAPSVRSGLYETTLPLSVPAGEYRVFAVAVGQDSLPVAVSPPSTLTVSAPAGVDGAGVPAPERGVAGLSGRSAGTDGDTDAGAPAAASERNGVLTVEAAIGDGAGLEALVLLVPAVGALVALAWSRSRTRTRRKATRTSGRREPATGAAGDESDAEGRS